MKRLALFACLMVVTLTASAQFEKGKWFANPTVTGFQLTRNTETDKTTFGLEANGGYFFLDNLAVTGQAGATWNYSGGNTDVYSLGVGVRYYFDKVGIYVGMKGSVKRYDFGNDEDDTKGTFGLEAGYAFFLNRHVTLEPALFWDINDDYSNYGLKLGFGFYF